MISNINRCKEPVTPTDYKTRADTLQWQLDSLQHCYTAACTNFAEEQGFIIMRYEGTEANLQKEIEKHRRIIADMRKKSNNEAHEYLKQNYTPSEALIKVLQLDSCMIVAEATDSLLKDMLSLNELKTEFIMFQQDLIDTCFKVADNSIIELSSCGAELNDATKQNQRLRKWCKGLGVAAVVSLLVNFVLIQ